MQDQEPLQSASLIQRSRRRSGIIAGLSAVVLLVGSGTAWITWKSHSNQQVTPPNPAVSTQPTASPEVSPVPNQQTIQVYWLKSAGERIELVPSPVTVSAAEQPDATLKAAFAEMLKGSTSPDLTSTIPAGTKLLGLETKPDGIHVDLSQEFTSGGGSTSMQGRVGQVIYTATTIDPNAKVWLSVAGKPLEVLGGEGIIIDQPTTREDFQKNFAL